MTLSHISIHTPVVTNLIPRDSGLSLLCWYHRWDLVDKRKLWTGVGCSVCAHVCIRVCVYVELCGFAWVLGVTWSKLCFVTTRSRVIFSAVHAFYLRFFVSASGYRLMRLSDESTSGIIPSVCSGGTGTFGEWYTRLFCLIGSNARNYNCSDSFPRVRSSYGWFIGSGIFVTGFVANVFLPINFLGSFYRFVDYGVPWLIKILVFSSLINN